MRVAIIGARTRGELADASLVNGILDHCIETYAKLLVITKSCDRGVGKIIRDRCQDPHVEGKIWFELAEFAIHFKVFNPINRQEFLSYWNALNSSLVVMGEEFHLLTEEYPKGNMADLLNRIKNEHVPYALYRPSEAKLGPKRPDFGGGVHITLPE